MGILAAKSLGAPGSWGMNTQESPIDLTPQFATEAYNAVIDEEGRLAARKAFIGSSNVISDLSGNSLKTLYINERKDGTFDIISAGNGKMFYGDVSPVTFYTGGTADNWEFATLNGKLFAAQASHAFVCRAETAYATPVTITASFTNPNCVHSAYGRLWVGNVNGNDYTLYWSKLLDGTDFSGTGAGSLDLTSVFVNGKDSIVAIGSHNNKIIVFCRKSTYIFGLPETLDPNGTGGIHLEDTIANVGCFARDSVVSTGDDLLWLSDIGVQSLQRRVQYETLPYTDMSVLVLQNIINRVITTETAATVKGYYFPLGGWYLLTAPSSNTVWVFNMAVRVPTIGVPRITQWVSTSKTFYDFTSDRNGNLLCASKERIWKYSSYGSTQDPHLFRLTSGWLSLESPEALKHFKKMLLTIKGGSGQTGTLSWALDFKDNWQGVTFSLNSEQSASEYNVGEYNIAEYSVGALIDDIYNQIAGSGRYIKFRIETQVQGNSVGLYNTMVFTTQGKIR